MKEILFLQPVLKEMIWGGNRLKADFGYETELNNVGECWGISAHPNGDCIIESGTFEGEKLSELWTNHKELFGNQKEKEFPLLVKIIDAKEDLSIQVHPDDQYAAEHENGSLGKTECWYILDSKEDGEIVIGHHAQTKDELNQMIDNKEWTSLIRTMPVKAGDFFQIDPGTVHAIKGGTLILEIQQSSDITYRVYDYDRLMDGKPRELHIKKSKEVITVPFTEDNQSGDTTGGHHGERLVCCPYYTVEKILVNQHMTIEQDQSFMLVSVIDGSGTIDGHQIKKGSHFIVPYKYGIAEFQGDMELICSYI